MRPSFLNTPEPAEGDPLAGIQRALRDQRQLQLSGPAGCGKSTLAARLARGAQRPHWVDLGGRSAPPALSLPEGCDLLVLDAADTLSTEASATLRASLAASSPAPPTLWTARHPFAGLPQHPVPPLSPKESARLLRWSIGAPGRSAILEEEALRSLSAALGGRPGDLLRVAPLLRLHEPAALLADIERGAPLPLPHPDPGTSTPDEARLWRLLGLFRGPVRLDLLADLLERPLIDGVAAGLLAAGRALATPPCLRLHPAAPPPAPSQREHRGWWHRLAERHLPRWQEQARALDGPASQAAFQALEEDAPALDALSRAEDDEIAIAAGLVLHAVALRARPLQDALDLDQRLAGRGDRDTRARWGLAAARALERRTDYQAALARLQSDPLPEDPELLTRRWSLTALFLTQTGQEDAAASAREAALRHAAGGPDEGRARYRLAIAAFTADRPAEALHTVAPLLDEAAPGVNALLRLQALIFHSVLSRQVGRPSEELLALCAMMHPLWREGGHLQQGPLVLVLEAVLHGDAERWQEQARAFAEAVALLERLDRPAEAASQRAQLLALSAHQGQLDRALLTPQPGEAGFPAGVRAELASWRGIALIVHDAPSAGVELLERSIPALLEGGFAARGVELALYALASLHAAGAAALGGPLAALIGGRTEQPDLQALWRGEAWEGAPRWEHHLLRDLRAPPARCRVDREGRWFQAPGQERVDLRRRQAMRRILGCLARADAPVTLEQLIEAGWPGEALVGESGRRRVEVALSTLRRLGLRAHLATLQTADGARWELDALTV